MQNYLKYIYLLCISCLCAAPLAAHEAKDTLAASVEVNKKPHYRDIGFSAADYHLQKRYRPANDPFAAKRFIDNTFFSLTGDAQQLHGLNGRSYSMQYAVGANIGKWINEYNAVRLGASVGTYVMNKTNSRVYTMGLEADYLFNLTSYMWGYRRSRFCEWSTVLGLGYMASRYNGEYKDFFNFHMGMNLSMKTGKYVDLFFEPLIYFHGNDITWDDKLSWRDYNFSPGLKVGLTYNVQPKEYRRGKVDYMEDSFISIAAGPQFEHSGAVLNERLGMGRSLRPHYMISFGKIYRDGFGFRTSAAFSNDIWKLGTGGRMLKAGYTALRLEAMYDFMSLGRNLREDFPFALSVLFGPEAGIVKKEENSGYSRHVYVGAAGGLQAKYRFINGLALFVEPRFTALQYSGLLRSGSPERANYKDVLFSANLGLEVSLKALQRSSRNLRKNAEDKDEFIRNRFWDNTFISLTGESLQLFPTNGSSYSTQYTVGGNIGKWFNPYHALRLGASFGTFVKNADGSRFYNVGGEADYLFNISSYTDGYDRNRFCSVSTVAGLGYRLSRHYGSFKDYINAHLGLNIAFNVGKHIDFFLEPLAYFQGDDMIWRNEGESTWRDNINLRNFIAAPALKVGLTYNVQPKGQKRTGTDYLEDAFISFGAGLQFEHSGLVLNSLGMIRSLRPHLMFSFGKEYVDGFGARTSIIHSNDIWKVAPNGGRLKAGYTALRLEAMYDFMSLGKNLRDDFPFALSILIGPEAGVVKKEDVARDARHVYVGATGGLQAKYRFTDVISYFIEPRFTGLMYSDLLKAGSPVRANYKDVLFNLNFGVEVALGTVNRRPRPVQAQFSGRKFMDNTFISLTGESLQLFWNNGSSYSTQYAVGGNIGKWFDQYNALRLGASVGTFVRNANGNRLYTMGAEADHMFNLTALWSDRSSSFCEVSTVEGIGYRLSHQSGSFKDYLNIHVGFNFAMKMGRHVDLFLEPLAYFQGDDMIWKNKGESTWRDNIDLKKFIFAPALKVGLTYNAVPKDHRRPAVNYLENSFISIAAGPQFEHSGSVLNDRLGMGRSLRPHYMLSFGKFYTDGFAVRTSVTYSNDIWKIGSDDRLFKAGYTAMRLEGMYDFMSLDKSLRKDFPFSLSIVAGPEAGIVRKQDASREIRHVYVGATGGLQFKCRIAKPVSIFLEPRMTALIYSDLLRTGSPTRANYKDVLFNLNLGLEFDL